MHCEQAHLTKNRRQILFRSLGVRNKSNTVVFICAVFSSSCMVTLKPFNNSKHISFANIVRGIVVSIGSQKDRNDVFPFFLRVCPKSLQLCLILCDPMDCSPLGSSVWDFPGKNIGVGCHFLLRGIFPTQGSNLHLLCLPPLAGRFFTTSTTWKAPPSF